MTTRFLFLAVTALLGLTLGACETVQRDIQTSVADTQIIFTDFSMDKLLASTPVQPHDSSTLIAESGSFAATRAEMQVDEHIITGDKKIIPVPGHRQTQKEEMVASVKPVEKSTSSCPDVRIVGDLNQVHQFSNGKAAPGDSVSSIWLQDVTEDCKIGSKNISIEMTLAFEGILGPKGKARKTDTPSFAYPYFVAITNNHGNIVAKEVFAVTLTYDNQKTTGTKIEKIRQAIPVASTDMRNYKILVGFQLNDEELAYNRTLPSDTTLGNIAPASGGN